MFSKLLKNISESKSVNNFINYLNKEGNGYILALFMVGTNVAKDIVAYSSRAVSSLHNDEIPKDKKPFVVAMDAVTVFTTSTMQVLAGLMIANPKVNSFIQKNLFKKQSENIRPILQNTFLSLSTLIFSGIITERVFVPLVTTPVAEALKKKFQNHRDKPYLRRKHSDVIRNKQIHSRKLDLQLDKKEKDIKKNDPEYSFGSYVKVYNNRYNLNNNLAI